MKKPLKKLVTKLARNVNPLAISAISLVIVFASAVGVSAGLILDKELIVQDGDTKISIFTMDNTVREALERNNLAISDHDYINVPLDAPLNNLAANEVSIKRAVPVQINADGVNRTVMTYYDTVGDLLKNGPVRISPQDRLEGAAPEDMIYPGMKFRIVRVREEETKEVIPIHFREELRENRNMDKGSEKIVREGKDGAREKTFRVVFEDGVQILKELVKDVVTLQPVNRIIEYGTILNYKTARGDVIRYRKVMDMRATAYTASFKDTGKSPDHPDFGITYLGWKARKGIIAVDPKVIPLRSKVYVEVAGSTPDYGFAVAGDIGSAIKGNLIDLYMDDQETVDRWGCKRVKVYILVE